MFPTHFCFPSYTSAAPSPSQALPIVLPFMPQWLPSLPSLPFLFIKCSLALFSGSYPTTDYLSVPSGGDIKSKQDREHVCFDTSTCGYPSMRNVLQSPVVRFWLGCFCVAAQENTLCKEQLRSGMTCSRSSYLYLSQISALSHENCGSYASEPLLNRFSTFNKASKQVSLLKIKIQLLIYIKSLLNHL